MKGKNEKRRSLYLEWILLLFVAGIVSLLFFMFSAYVAEGWIDRYYEDREVIRNFDKKYIASLQEYITEQNISSEEPGKLDGWVDENRLIYIEIEKDNKWIYSSGGYAEWGQMEQDVSFYVPESSYFIEFTDGTARVYIVGMYFYNTYTIVLIMDIVISVALFLMLTMFGIRKKILYINRLSRDIEILEGGNLEHEVQVQGNDELADLARGLNAMKVSFRSQIEEVEYLTKSNQELVTEISHDLRTPLTSVLLYAEILKSGKYEGEKGREIYLDKIMKKVQYMKNLSDGLLAYSVQAAENRYVPARYKPLAGALYDELSDMCQYLEEQGWKVKTEMQWKSGQIRVCEEYLVRIFDNISSNVLKYADREAPVLIWDAYPVGEVCVYCENLCLRESRNTGGYNIGIRNIRMMMEAMGGKCDVIQEEEKFRIGLRFSAV